MIYFIKKNKVDQLPEDSRELDNHLQQMVQDNEAILIDRIPAEMQMQSMELLLGNPAFTLIHIQESHIDRFIRSPLHGHASEVYQESLDIVTSYIRDLQFEIEKGAAALANYQQGEKAGMVKDSLRRALSNLGERREVTSMILQELHHRLGKQAERENSRPSERFTDNEWNT
ncbi:MULTISPECIES: hypothetical protein [Paenibacillus]|uniref:hypothetical protein n=1 Tax=Paenibacillus TaxID=44249 RepID=UPI00037C0636|nr:MULTISPECIES: hypothetical protein [Paenibacillus]